MKYTIITLFFAALCTTPLIAQNNSPSMSPGAKKENSLPVPNFMGGDRPKGAKTEISADNEASFDSAKNIAEFVGNVRVLDPQFTLTCDKLLVTLAPNRKGLATVEASGNVEIIQDANADTPGAVKAIGRAAKIFYDAVTGKATLTGWPQVQHGLNKQVATEEGTIMILNRNGKSTTTGGSRTIVGDSSNAN